LNTLC